MQTRPFAAVARLVAGALAIALVGLALALAGGLPALDASASTPFYACALNGNGQLRLATGPGQCDPKREQVYDLANPSAPSTLCATVGEGQLRIVTSPDQCKKNEFAIPVPGLTQLDLCSRNDNGALRLMLTPCSTAEETYVVIPS